MNPKFLLNSLIALSIASFSSFLSHLQNVRETDLSSGHSSHKDSTVKHCESESRTSLTPVILYLVLRELSSFCIISKLTFNLLRKFEHNDNS